VRPRRCLPLRVSLVAAWPPCPASHIEFTGDSSPGQHEPPAATGDATAGGP